MATKKRKRARTEEEWMWIYENRILKEDAAFDKYIGGCFHAKPYWYKDGASVKNGSKAQGKKYSKKRKHQNTKSGSKRGV